MTEDHRQVAIARAVATIAHRGQTDKAGQPYITHPARVAAKLVAQGVSENIVAAGWLHDVLEDTDLTTDDLRAAGVNGSVVYYVETVTRRIDQTPEDYYEQVSSSSGAWTVKVADIADNTDPNRLALLDDETIARLTRKYAKARLLLGIPGGTA